MLLTLAIRDIVLIERLDLEFAPGLCVLTGETGAGKSILLDALGLALGRRGESGLIRDGARQASVAATFHPPPDHPARRLLAEQGIAASDLLVLRRVLPADGPSRAFINDEPVGVALLRRLGQALVEVHGQNDEQGLLDSATHRGLLDAFGGHHQAVAAVRQAYETLSGAEAAMAAAASEAAAASRDQSYLRHVADELAALAPEIEEEEQLVSRRVLLMQGEKLAAALREVGGALAEGGGLQHRLRSAERGLQRFDGVAQERLGPVRAALERLQAEAAELEAALDGAERGIDLDPAALEQVEERLFALRAAARKHGVAIADLTRVRDEAQASLARLVGGEERLAGLRLARERAAAAYDARAAALSQARARAAARLDKALSREFKPLKLGDARFATRLEPLKEGERSAEGAERVVFTVTTNPNTAPGPLARIASGGELSRFMLALKMVLAGEGDAATLVFDEVDRGIGGATADAVGERLARLAEGVQILVVTHSPQVAARAAHHWHITKSAIGRGQVRTAVVLLDALAREEEIARMLAGASITDQARAAARRLIEGAAP